MVAGHGVITSPVEACDMPPALCIRKGIAT